MFYDSLVKKSADGKLVPWLATEWDTTDPNKTILKIRDGVTFHDGTPLTAADVAYSIAARADPDLIASTAGRPIMTPDQWVSAEAVDDLTVEVNTTGRVEFLVDPQPVLVVPNESFGKINFANEENGTGPFTLKSFTSGTGVDGVAYEDYWDGRPPLDELSFAFFADPATASTGLRSGQVDGLYDVAAEEPRCGQRRAQHDGDRGGDVRLLVDHPDGQGAARQPRRAPRPALPVRRRRDQQRLVPRQGHLLVEPVQPVPRRRRSRARRRHLRRRRGQGGARRRRRQRHHRADPVHRRLRRRHRRRPGDAAVVPGRRDHVRGRGRRGGRLAQAHLHRRHVGGHHVQRREPAVPEQELLRLPRQPVDDPQRVQGWRRGPRRRRAVPQDPGDAVRRPGDRRSAAAGAADDPRRRHRLHRSRCTRCRSCCRTTSRVSSRTVSATSSGARRRLRDAGDDGARPPAVT